MTLVLKPCKCGHELSVGQLLDGLPADGGGSTGFFVWLCSRCNERTVLSIQPGRIESGFTYWAGSLHFEAMYSERVPDLAVEPSDPDDLKVSYQAKSWHFANRRIQKARFVIPPDAAVIGVRFCDLNLGQWGISATSCERDGAQVSVDPNLVLQAGDALSVEGVERMLARVWRRITEGR